MKSKIKVAACTKVPSTAFKDLHVGDWYVPDHCSYGLCVKTGPSSFLSVERGQALAANEDWPCTIHNVSIKHRRA